MNTCCLPVPRGATPTFTVSGLSLLTVGYSFWTGNRDLCYSGIFYIFGQWGSESTRKFLLYLFVERHPTGNLIEFYFENSQP